MTTLGGAFGAYLAGMLAGAMCLSGCVIDGVDVEGRACAAGECPNGLICDLSRLAEHPDGVCVTALPSGCDNPRHLFCDDFEDGIDPRWRQVNPEAGSTLEPQTAIEARAGTGSLRASAEAPRAIASLVVDAFEEPTDDQWVRAFVRLESAADLGVLVMTMSGAGMVPLALTTGVFDGRLEITSGYPAEASPMFVFPTGQWVCLEQHVIPTSTAGLLEVYVDGVTVFRQELDTSGQPLLGTVAVGVERVSDFPGLQTVLVDDVAISTVRVGCE